MGNRKTGSISERWESIHHDSRRAIWRCKKMHLSGLIPLSEYSITFQEKSVGTIMYLMAIQNMTCCPFRVVDEINQGMDVYNERKVFHRITKASCGKKFPQYFLITPKLITRLEYHRDTKVMVILNGPFNKLSQERMHISHFLPLDRLVIISLCDRMESHEIYQKSAK